MKVRIKSGDCPEYLTVGKVYDANKLLKIIDDKQNHIFISLYDCEHLNSGSWEIVEE